MRLIDADKLYGELWEIYIRKESTKELKKKSGYLAGFIDVMGDASTIEAIPIEWLEQFGVTRYQRNLISNIIGTWREEQGDEAD